MVTAVENATGKKNNITITNDKGRLTKDEIKNMISDAEKYKEQDQEMKVSVAARNDLEAYIYQMKSLVNDNNVAGKIGSSDKTKILKKCDELTSWLSANETASEKNYVMKKQELEKICKPVMIALYAAANRRSSSSGRTFPNTGNDNNDDGPTIEEVD